MKLPCEKIIVFIPIDDIRNSENPYVPSIIENIEKSHKNISFIDGVSKLWDTDFFDFDVLHIMWPNYVLCGRTALELKSRLLSVKQRGKKIVSTCHNLVPHYDTNKENIASYELVYSFSDEIYHLGEYSLNLFRKKYQDKNQKLLWHPVYNRKYPYFPSKQESLKKLGLSPKKRYVLCFGQIRDNEERCLIDFCAKKLKNEKIYFIVPSYMPFRLCKSKTKWKHAVKILLKFIFIFYKKIFASNIIFNFSNKVPEGEIPFYFNACDVGFIQRLHILNSGNLPLNYYYGNIVAGPDIGNVGEILKKTGNPVFNVKDFNSAVKALRLCFIKTDEKLGDKNRDFAIENWAEEEIAEQQYLYYTLLFMRTGGVKNNSNFAVHPSVTFWGCIA